LAQAAVALVVLQQTQLLAALVVLAASRTTNSPCKGTTWQRYLE
jgi:hypothetical protein